MHSVRLVTETLNGRPRTVCKYCRYFWYADIELHQEKIRVYFGRLLYSRLQDSVCTNSVFKSQCSELSRVRGAVRYSCSGEVCVFSSL